MDTDLNTKLKTHINHCLNQLNEIHKVILNKQWNNIEVLFTAYEDGISLLRTTCELSPTLPPAFEDDFKNLYYKHRRIVRLMHTNLKVITEDIESINTGASRLKRILAFVQAQSTNHTS